MSVNWDRIQNAVLVGVSVCARDLHVAYPASNIRITTSLKESYYSSGSFFYARHIHRQYTVVVYFFIVKATWVFQRNVGRP